MTKEEIELELENQIEYNKAYMKEALFVGYMLITIILLLFYSNEFKNIAFYTVSIIITILITLRVYVHYKSKKDRYTNLINESNKLLKEGINLQKQLLSAKNISDKEENDIVYSRKVSETEIQQPKIKDENTARFVRLIRRAKEKSRHVEITKWPPTDAESILVELEKKTAFEYKHIPNLIIYELEKLIPDDNKELKFELRELKRNRNIPDQFYELLVKIQSRLSNGTTNFKVSGEELKNTLKNLYHYQIIFRQLHILHLLRLDDSQFESLTMELLEKIKQNQP